MTREESEKKQEANKHAFGIRLKNARNKLGMSQEELADKIGTTKSMISSYENAINDARQSIIPLLADALGVTTSWLLLGAVSESGKEGLPGEPAVISHTVDIMETLTDEGQQVVVQFAEITAGNQQYQRRVKNVVKLSDETRSYTADDLQIAAEDGGPVDGAEIADILNKHESKK